MDLLISVFAIFVFFVIWYFAQPGKAAGSNSSAGTNFNKLVAACGGDSEKAFRLVRFEKNRNPLITDGEAALRAYDRLISDRSR